MKILFIHGLASSGAYKTATTLHALMRPCEVIAPDVPIDPDQAWEMLSDLCLTQKPDLVVGLSLGGFWAQKLRGYKRILVNPGFHASRLMRTMIGEVKYLSPRKDGASSFFITKDICDCYELLESHQFDDITSEDSCLVRAMFADEDEMVRCGPEFEIHYPGRAIYYPGQHLPTHPQLKMYLKPLADELIK